jgi:hypothetical protein
MTTWLLPVSLLLTFLAGVLLLTAYLWYRYALRLHAESLSPENALGVRLLRYDGAAGLSSFGGFLLVFVFYLLATRTGSTAVAETIPLLEVAVGLFLLSLSTSLVAGLGYGADALRTRLDDVR